MKRNSETRWNFAPTVKAPRSTMPFHSDIITACDAGLLVPVYVDNDILPGDTWDINATFVIRQATPIYPTMDNLVADFYLFFDPHRLVWDHWEEFAGAVKDAAWVSNTTYTIPQIKFEYASNNDRNVKLNSIHDYMGVPITSFTNNDGKKLEINALPYRHYCNIWNEWFRPASFVAPRLFSHGDATVNAEYYPLNQSAALADWRQNANTSAGVTQQLAPVAKLKDYLTSNLPAPQRGLPISLPLGQAAEIKLDHTKVTNGQFYYDGTDTKIINGDFTNIGFGTDATGKINSGTQLLNLDPNGTLYADLSNAVAATINAQRMAFAAQRILEKDARGGCQRYTEILQQHFGVTSPDARLQRPEYLGGFRQGVVINQIPQTSSTDNTSPQGNLAGFSLTVASHHICKKSFTEHGCIMGFLVIRIAEHRYSQSLAKQWSRKNRLDFYWPSLAYLGEQATLNKEIYFTGTSTDDQVFGYQERWAEYRYRTNLVTGIMRPNVNANLASWHYGDKYNNLPVLNYEWIFEDNSYIARTLAVQNQPQFIVNGRIEGHMSRCMPLNSIPGLLDHY